ncbi:hypothetical protein [Micromonospora carbonacea]|uniref:Uncharacterized protein n=1 Tax=Micromonospora carbonacea TaxID=47853 RepID=A0A1C4VHH4_9ACTN|nr:hypothetical protein [Micromonospora carbonacea]SCE83239.1 hypothetical protein GA0070563_102278 [Micromonospora carbonacea]
MRVRAALVAAGVLLMGYAVVGGSADPDLKPAGVLLFLAGVLAGHDLVWMAALLAVGAAVARFVPRRHRPVARAAAISAAALTVVAAPLVLGFGRRPDNPSVLPLPYGRNLAVVLLVVAGATLAACLAADLRRRSTAGRGRGRSTAGRKRSERPGGGGPPAAGG